MTPVQTTSLNMMHLLCKKKVEVVRRKSLVCGCANAILAPNFYQAGATSVACPTFWYKKCYNFAKQFSLLATGVLSWNGKAGKKAVMSRTAAGYGPPASSAAARPAS